MSLDKVHVHCSIGLVTLRNIFKYLVVYLLYKGDGSRKIVYNMF